MSAFFCAPASYIVELTENHIIHCHHITWDGQILYRYNHVQCTVYSVHTGDTLATAVQSISRLILNNFFI